MLTTNWISLTPRTKNYKLKVRLGLPIWLPAVQNAISPKELWTFISSYWQEFVDIVNSEYYINLDNASDLELAKFFFDTGLFYVEKKDGTQLTKNQKVYLAGLMKFYAPQILNWIRQGDIYSGENIY